MLLAVEIGAVVLAHFCSDSASRLEVVPVGFGFGVLTLASPAKYVSPSGLVISSPEKTPQGPQPSVLIYTEELIPACLYLNEVDHRMADAGYEMVRYADDFVILCRSQEQAERAPEEVKRYVHKAGLKLHPEKTHIVDSQEKSFSFLGYSFRGGFVVQGLKAIRR